MKEEKRNAESTVYVAVDGTEFSSKNDCIAYEKTLECVLKSKINIHIVNEWNLCYGDEEHDVEVITGNSDDVKIYVAHKLSFYGNEQEIINTIKSIKHDSVTLLFKNCEDFAFKAITLDDFIENIKSRCIK